MINKVVFSPDGTYLGMRGLVLLPRTELRFSRYSWSHQQQHRGRLEEDARSERRPIVLLRVRKKSLKFNLYFQILFWEVLQIIPVIKKLFIKLVLLIS